MEEASVLAVVEGGLAPALASAWARAREERRACVPEARNDAVWASETVRLEAAEVGAA